MAANKAKSTRKTWTKEETLGSLKCYAARQEKFQHSRKRKDAFANVLEDMLFAEYTDSSTTKEALEGKLRTLLSAYKSAKDHQRRTGASPCPAPFMEEMEELFGHKPIVSNSHSITLDGSVESTVPVRQIDEVAMSEERAPTPPSTSTVRRIINSKERTPSPSASPGTSNRRKSAKECYYDAKLALKKEQGEKQLALKKEQGEKQLGLLEKLCRERMHRQ